MKDLCIYMKSLFIISILSIVFSNEIIAQTKNNTIPDGTFYLVRHGEKDTGANPVLSKLGNLRAGDLYRLLKDKKIGKIYFTQYRRTMITGDSLRLYTNTDTVRYKADAKGDDIVNKLLSEKVGQNILIIGHSNTIPAIVRRLGVPDFKPEEIPDNEYDNLYIVTIKDNKASVEKLKYGKASQ